MLSLTASNCTNISRLAKVCFTKNNFPYAVAVRIGILTCC